MKNNKIIYLLVLLLGFTCYSCEKDEYKEANSSVYIAQTPVAAVDVYDINETFVYDLGIYRSGFGVSATADVQVQGSTELDSYNSQYGTDYKLLPAEYYKLNNSSVDFSTGLAETNRYVQIEFKVGPLKTFLEQATETYALPIALTTSSIAINQEKSTTILVPEVKEPYVSLAFTGVQQYSFDYGKVPPFITLEIPVFVEFNNEWDITCTLDNPQEILEEYNEAENKKVQLITDNYKMDQSVVLKKGQKRVKSTLVIETNKLPIGSHGLPIHLKELSDDKFTINTSANDYLVGVDIIVPAYNRTGWEATTNSDDLQWGKGVQALLDGDGSTIWHSAGDFQSGTGEPKKEVEIIIDMIEERNVMQIDLMQRQDNTYDTRAGDFYISSDGSSWKKIGNFVLEDIKPAQGFLVESSTGRYLKTVITKATRHVAGLSEIIVRGLAE